MVELQVHAMDSTALTRTVVAIPDHLLYGVRKTATPVVVPPLLLLRLIGLKVHDSQEADDHKHHKKRDP